MPLLMAPCSAASIVCVIASTLAYDSHSNSRSSARRRTKASKAIMGVDKLLA